MHGEATHIIDKVLFGYEAIRSMQRPVNLRRESKEDAEDAIYLAAETSMKQFKLIGLGLPPTQLENISCNLYSNISLGRALKNFQQSSSWKKDAIKGNGPLRQVEIVMKHIPEEEKLNTRKCFMYHI